MFIIFLRFDKANCTKSADCHSSLDRLLFGPTRATHVFASFVWLALHDSKLPYKACCAGFSDTSTSNIRSRNDFLLIGAFCSEQKASEFAYVTCVYA